jgi:hypothetical protein
MQKNKVRSDKKIHPKTPSHPTTIRTPCFLSIAAVVEVEMIFPHDESTC